MDRMIGPASYSGEKSADAVIYAAPAFLHGFELQPPTIGYATLKIYDNASAASGTLIASATVAAGMNSIYLDFTAARACNNGIYADITVTSTSTTYSVAFSPC